MLNKIWQIAYKDLYITFTDRNLLLIMLAAPLAIATIIGLAFGGVGGSAPIRDVPIVIVNQDGGEGEQNFGQTFVNAFIPPESVDSAAATTDCPAPAESSAPQAASTQVTLQDLTDAVLMTDAEAARAAVNAGTYTVALIIPPDFTQRLSYGQNNPIEPTSVEVYANPGRPISGAVVSSIVTAMGNQMATGSIAAATTVDTTIAELGFQQITQVAGSEVFTRNITCAFTAAFNAVRIDEQTVSGQQANSTAAILVLFGSAQAMFFMLFTGQQGVLSIFEEKTQGTLQRLAISPTPRLSILVGKMLGTFITCLAQLIVLFIALTAVASLLSGEFTLIWGNNLLLVAVVVLAAALAATGLGAVVAGIAKTPEQAGIIGQLINLAMALLGGAFAVTVPEALARFSIIYWGTNAFQKLAANQTDIALNLLVLTAFGGILFAAGFWLFNRRLEV
jgi:ABC-2 type transport system permease protein